MVNDKQNSRDKKSLVFQLINDDWPSDVPLPDGTTQVNPENVKWPKMTIDIYSNKNKIIVGGNYWIPGKLDTVTGWFQEQLTRKGWREESKLSNSERTMTIKLNKHNQERTLVLQFGEHYEGEKTSVIILRIARISETIFGLNELGELERR